MAMPGLRLNLGCGANHIDGYINVDKHGKPDLMWDLETFPWPWESDQVQEVLMIHVLEHLGRDTEVYLAIIRELYRVCQHGAKVVIAVPHHNHQFFHDDPTHVRAITPTGLTLFSKKANQYWIDNGNSNTPLALYLDVDFEIRSTLITPGQDWFRLHPEQANEVDIEQLVRESSIHNNLIEQYTITLEVIKT